jgi:hypothetical protein
MRFVFTVITLALAAGICLLPLRSGAQEGRLLQTPYQPAFSTGTINAFFTDIRRQTGITVSFSASFLDAEDTVTVSQTPQTIGAILELLLAGHNVSLTERRYKILVIPSRKKDGCTISGYVRDQQSREILIGVSIYVPSLKVGTVTNSYGFFSLTLPQGNHTAYISYVGYKTDTAYVDCSRKNRWEILLEPANTLKEVNITSERGRPSSGADHMQLSPGDIYQQQALLGETDVLRALQKATGVQSGIDGSSSIMVRGGDPGQNLYLLDGVPLYYVDHLFGLTSVFNTEAIKSVDFYKGAFPARYGGRLSSIIDVRTRDGDMDRIGGQFAMGLVKSTLNLEGPIVKDKASFMISGRRTWIDGLVYPFTRQIGINFYDINAKGNWIINKNNRIYLSYYSGRDQVRFAQDDDALLRTRWGNNIASLKWTTVLSSKLFLNTILTYSHFEYELKDQAEVIDSNGISKEGTYTGASTINEGAARLQLEWFPNYRHKIEAGGSYTYGVFEPTKIVRVNARIPLPVSPVSNEFASNEVTFFVEDEIKLGRKWVFRPGLHWSKWFNPQFDYSGLQPRVYGAYRLPRRQLIYASASRMVQFLHLISNNSYGLPTDFWVPSTERIKPERAWLMTLGYSGKYKELRYNTDIYYKYIDGVIVYTTGKNIFDNSPRWQDKILQGIGRSYGIELSGDHRVGPLQISLAYTLSWNWRQFPQLNEGKPFPYRYDRRHNLKISTICKLGKSSDLGVNWTYMSGEAFTIPDQIYPDLDNNLGIIQTSATSADYTYHYANWNAYRLPDIHRLDLGCNFTRKRSEHYIRTWSMGVFNAYGRPNIMFVTLDKDETDGLFKLQRLSVLQFIPYITYKLQF